MSHDLRAPLRSIDGFSQVLLEDYADRLDAQDQDCLRRVRAGAQRMGELIDDLLGLSRVGRVEVRPETVDLAVLARSVVAQLRSGEPDRDVEVVTVPRLPVKGDANLLGIALDNLLRNAWKFSAKRERARIEVGSIIEGGEAVYFVRDNGAGFDMAYSGKLFAPFQRLHPTSELEGTGIGLAIVRRVVQRHRGRVWAEGEVERGATFFFTLGNPGDPLAWARRP